jgi:hypothetical protein
VRSDAVKKTVDPLEELRRVKRKISRELEEARKKGRLTEKLKEYEREARKILRPKKRAQAR